jgi:GrpB-like predicted nucleotidyltransferase (UPF0157 family)
MHEKQKHIGLRSGRVKLAEYNDGWPGMFEEEKGLLESALRDIGVADMQHVGSTSVPGMKSKPVIDIAVGVKRLSDGKRCIEPLEGIGYEYRGDAGVPGRHFFTKGTGESRTHHVNVEPVSGGLWKNHILLRDYLRKNPGARREYQELKEGLEKKYPEERNKYTAEKDSFIGKMLGRVKS